jgi:hypothetical protein
MNKKEKLLCELFYGEILINDKHKIIMNPNNSYPTINRKYAWLFIFELIIYYHLR